MFTSYKLTSGYRDSDGIGYDASTIIGISTTGNSHIPMDNDNRHYQEYLVWVAEGNTPEAAD